GSPRTLTANYSGDTSFNNSTSPTANQTITAAATTTSITGHSPSPSGKGSPVLVTFSVSANAPGSGTPAGTVTVSDGTTSCTAAVSAGQCSITLNTVGANMITATYGATPAYLSSSNTVSHTVQPGTTSIVTSS